MARRNDHSRDELRRMALDAAGRLVAEEGPRALTARAVAGAMGYSAGTLYLVFRNLDDLILQLNARTLEELGAALYDAAGEAAGPEDALRAMGRAYLGFARAHPHRFRLVFDHRLPEGEAAPAFYQERVDALFGAVEAALAPLSAASMGQVAAAARALWGGVHGIVDLGLGDKLRLAGGLTMEALAGRLIDTFISGYTAGAVAQGGGRPWR